MPELPEVETVARQLRPELLGRAVTGVELGWARTVQTPGPAAFRRGLIGRRFTSVGRRGKYLLLGLDDARVLTVHLRMTGRLSVDGPPGAPPAPGSVGRPDWVRVRLLLDDGRALVFSDVRKFGRMALTRHPERVLPALGPEPLSDEVDGDWMAVALAARRRQLKPLLLDQSFLAGIGNIYADEALHRAGLHPLRLSHRVSRTAAKALAGAIRDVLSSAIEQEGSSFDAFYRTPEGQPGRYQDDFAVYGRQGRPCRTCGAPIRRLVVAQRGTHLCPRCQPAPRRRSKAAGTR